MVDLIKRGGLVIKARNFRQLGFVDAKSDDGTPIVIELRLAGRASTIPSLEAFSPSPEARCERDS